MAAYTLQRNEHVRVDILAHRLGERGLAWLDLIGIVAVLLPVCLLMAWVTTPAFVSALVSGETRSTREMISDIPAWIIKSFVPVGFFLLALQGVAEADSLCRLPRRRVHAPGPSAPAHRRGCVTPAVLVPAMFASLIVALLIGFPVAFSIAAVAALLGVIGLFSGYFEPPFLLAMQFRIEGFFRSGNLLSIALFLFMGMLLERTKIAEDMLHALERLSGGVRGGMAYTSVLVGASIAAITGFVSASVIAIGLSGLPAMPKRSYDPKLATGVAAALGTLAQILPPSIVLIVLADQLEVLLLDIHRGVLLPSAMLVGLYLLDIFILTRLRPQAAPLARANEKGDARGWHVWPKAMVAAGFPLRIILLVLASIYFGVATPTEGGAAA